MKPFIRRLIAFLLICVMALSLCLTALPQAKAADTTVTLYPEQASPFNNGEFQGWGTSLCWWANRVGGDPVLTEQAAELFFSDEGLSLDIARYNIGGGDDPKHNHITRSDSKIPGLWETYEMSEDGKDVTITYDITNDQNQLNVAKAALAANPDLYFEGFSNSAPYFMTKSGCTGGAAVDVTNNTSPDMENLNLDMYDDFAEYIAQCTKLLANEGIVFQSYSPMNEPNLSSADDEKLAYEKVWSSWTAQNPKQEGCSFPRKERSTEDAAYGHQSDLFIATRKALDEAGLNDVIVAGMDENRVYSTCLDIAELSSEAKNALGRIDTHTYNYGEEMGYRKMLKLRAAILGKDLWVSEVDGGSELQVGTSSMKGALGFAQQILRDMNNLQPAAWCIWDIVNMHEEQNFELQVDKYIEYDWNSHAWKSTAINDVQYPNRGVRDNYVSNKLYDAGIWGVALANHDKHEFILSQKYYGYGQFTRYINPGDTIIATDDSNHILAAYNRASGDIKIVAVNDSDIDKPYTFDLSAFSTVGGKVQMIRTSGSYDRGEQWAEIKGEATLNGKTLTTTLKASSITTYVIKVITAPLPDGEYTIQASDGKYLYMGPWWADIRDDGRTVTLVSDGQGYYSIKYTEETYNTGNSDYDNARNGVWYLDVFKDVIYDGQKVSTYKGDGTADNQKWEIIQNADGTYTLIGKKSGKALAWITTTVFVANPQSDSAAQKWKIIPLSPSTTPTTVYNTATLYDYSTAYGTVSVNNGTVSRNMHTEGLQIGKSDYNADLRDQIASSNPLTGLFFSHGNTANPVEKLDLSAATVTNGTGTIENAAYVTDGNQRNKAWTTWQSSEDLTANKSGKFTLSFPDNTINGLKQVKIYFIDRDAGVSADGKTYTEYELPAPTSVTLGIKSNLGGPYNVTVKSFSKVTTSNRMGITVATINFNSVHDSVTSLEIEATTTGDNWLAVSEVEAYGIITDETFSTKENIFPGHISGEDYNSAVTPGLANPNLTADGEISFTVPEAGLFTQDEGNKEVYNNIQIPYTYDPQTGYYTFSTNADDAIEYPGTDIHFADANGNGVIDRWECYDGATLVTDTSRYTNDGNSMTTNQGFYPFNIASGVTQDTNYHFGVQTDIEFYMTPDGTVSGASSAPLEFKFSGDDDVWVYIDGKLVLDLGGIHGRATGTINFATNTATVDNVIFYGADNNITGHGPVENSVFNVGTKTGVLGMTREAFSAQGKHTMKIFYLERGAYESNCLIRYNMPRAVDVHGETVVIDYGLPVVIDIMANDQNEYAQQSFTIGTLSTPKYGSLSVLTKNADGTYQEAENYATVAGYYYLEYTPTTYLSDIETITYTYGNNATAVATVIPATSMYYEENFRTNQLDKDGNYVVDDNGNYVYVDYITTTKGLPGFEGYEIVESEEKCAAYQEDGVVGTGKYSTYGTDTAYLTSVGDSHGTSYHFDTTKGGEAFKYTFTGTGTAIFARTSITSAYIRINIKDSAGKDYFNFTNPVNGSTIPYVYIDTKYNVANTTLYNIPVYNIEDMPYGTYTVTVSIAQPSQWYTGQNDFYLDGIRVYEPMGDNATALSAYTADKEANPSIVTLRDAILTENVQKTEIDIPVDAISTSHTNEEKYFTGGINRLSDGDLQTKAWTTWSNAISMTYGRITITPEKAISDLYSVEAYFVNKEGSNSCSIPQTAMMYCYTENGERSVIFGSSSFVSESEGVKVYKVTFLPLTTDKITKLIIDISHNDGTGRYMCLTELQFYSAGWSNQGKGFAVFTDTADSAATAGMQVRTVKEYESFGPKQEVYLNETAATGQQIGFVLDGWSAAKKNGARLYLGMKTPGGMSTGIKADVNTTEFEIKNTVDCYYDITDAIGDDGVVVITTEGFVSLTNLKGIGYDVKLAAGAKAQGKLFARMQVNEETPADRITDDSLCFKQASLTLSSDISINFYVSDSVLEGWEAPYVLFSKAVYDAEGSITGYRQEKVSAYTAKTSGDEAYHVFTFSGINATEMGSEITATLYASKDGVEYEGKTVTYSVLQYANNMLAKSDDAALRTMLVDLLNYGAEAQTYFGYNTANLVNAGLTDEQKAYATQTAPELTTCKGMTKHDGATVSFKSVSLVLKEKVTLNYYLDLTDYNGNINDLYLRVTYTDANGTAQERVIDGSEFVNRLYTDGAYYYAANFSGLNATQMRTVCTAEVFSKISDERVSHTVTYSIESYAYSKASGTDQALIELLDAMMKYGDSASSFFAK